MKSFPKFILFASVILGQLTLLCPASQGQEHQIAQWGDMTNQPTQNSNVVTTPSGLQFQDLVVGQGPSPQAGQTVIVHYTGWLTNGSKFDSSLDRGQPFDFVLGAGQVIKGWDEGVASMKVGGKRKLTIPPQLGYGNRGAAGVIPPGATLVFEVQLLGLR